jgi:light-regulated signal transduction histidine kinase (bacteriophytochrome)
MGAWLILGNMVNRVVVPGNHNMNSSRPGPAEEELARTREAFREFVFHAVHDLRGPLRAVSTSSDILASIFADSADERVTRCLRFIREGTDRMTALAKDIAAYWEEQGRDLELTQISLNAVLAQAQWQISKDLQKNAAVITHDLLPTVKGDFFAIATVFRHLIENACKFRGTEAPTIHVGSTQHGAEWILSVRDNGLGFKPDYAEAVFQPFKRLHGKEYPGSGLGLALAKSIIDQHGGRIWAESIAGRGSTFSFSLPVSD